MATVDALRSDLRFIVDDEVEPYLVSDEVIFRWFNDAYMRIQLESEQWKFLHKRGSLLVTEAGTPTYTMPAVRTLDATSLFATKAGEVARYPLTMQSYDWWLLRQQVSEDAQGPIHSIVIMPDNSWLVYPTPTEAWTIWGDMWLEPELFASDSDEPIWHENYHRLLLFEVLKVAATVWPEENSVNRINSELQANYIPLRRAFNRRYLESAQGAAPLM
jgi:hypothetical protein